MGGFAEMPISAFRFNAPARQHTWSTPGRERSCPWSVVMALLILLAGAALPWPGYAQGLRIEGRTIVDETGRRVTVTLPFKRVISLYGAHTENLFAMGAGDRVIGGSSNEDFPAEARRLPAFSYRDDPEKFLAARPDLVLTRPMIDRGYPQLVRRLQQSGITVVSLQPGTVEEMVLYWQALGVLTGCETSAAAMRADFRQAVAAIAALTADLQPQARVYFEAIHAKMKTFTPDSMAVFALAAAGGVNVAADAEPVRDTNIAAYGKERILARAAEIDVFLAQVGPMNPITVEAIREESGFHALRAVRLGRIHLIDERLVSRPTLRLLEGIFAIGGLLYPDRFTEEARASLPVVAKAARP
jgi:iron complex transport system substrate-binding protein